ncbi:hypothetical protein BBK82_03080 [Lentzea guizhouensis]|uniref:DNA-binding protein n=2 Tax=Lentzea guizhouensis TaxID=1586287 RepID=A0A1B2HXN3_9PSEU|nr:hypothetical protein BBK82_03080 [Lentzea guizhouensis]
MEHLVGAAEIGQMLRVGRQRVQQLVSREDFPAPEATLAMGKVWRTEVIRRWVIEHGREVYEDDEARSPGEAESGPGDH